MRHAATAATRAFAFPLDEPLDAPGRTAAAALGAALPRRCEVLSSPARRCVETAAGLDAVVDAALAECDFGSWGGRRLQELPDDEIAGWMTDPDAAPHGGESQRTFCARVAGWLDGQAPLDGTALAVTHGGVVKAAVVHALAAPLTAFWRIDVAPLTITELHTHGDGWTVTRVNHPVAA